MAINPDLPKVLTLLLGCPEGHVLPQSPKLDGNLLNGMLVLRTAVVEESNWMQGSHLTSDIRI